MTSPELLPQVTQIVRSLLNDGEFPEYRVEDDRGLEEDEYINFAMQVLSALTRAPSTVEVEDDAILPCDVFLPPATIIRKGVKLSVLLLGIKVREKFQGAHLTIDAPPTLASEKEDGKADECCPTCERTDIEFRGYQPERCKDPWHDRRRVLARAVKAAPASLFAKGEGK
jgi:hypothetical protein